MDKISNASNENEIHRVGSPFKEDSKNSFAKEALILGEGNDQRQGNLLLCKLGSSQF